MNILNIVVDFLFFVDILICFNSSYYDEDYKIVESRKIIAREYVRSWFFIDTLAIMPFELFFGDSVSFNGVLRIARIGRFYRLIKLTRLLRVLKILKERSKIMNYFQDAIKVSVGFGRLIFFIFVFLMLCHFVSCIWIFVATFDGLENTGQQWLIEGI